MTVYALHVVSRHIEYLAGLFSTRESALKYFLENYETDPLGAASTEHTYDHYIHEIALDEPEQMVRVEESTP